MTIHGVQFAHQDTEAAWSRDGRYVFFLREAGEGRARRNQIHQLEIDLDSEPLSFSELPDGDITELYVSPHSNHIVYKFDPSSGNERFGLGVLDYNQGEPWKVTHNKRLIFGGWTDSGFLYFELSEDEENWSLKEYNLEHRQPKDIEKVGFFPELLGDIDGVPLVINKHATFDNKIRWNGEAFAYLGDHRRHARLKSGNPALEGGVYCIRDAEDSHAGEIVRYHCDDENILRDDEVLDCENVLGLAGGEENYPRGEIEDFVVVAEKKLVVHINKDGRSVLYPVEGGEVGQEYILDEITEKIGEFWIEGMSYADNGWLILTVSSFNSPQHLWRLHLESKEVERLTKPSYHLPLKRAESRAFTPEGRNNQPLPFDPLPVQYFEIEPDVTYTQTVIFFHGGPAVQTTRKWDRVIASFLTNGFRVLAPNHRGSLGRGASFAGLDDYDENNEDRPKRLDVIEEAKHLILTLDEEVFLFGGSYGGWLTHKLITDGDDLNIKAAGSRNGIFNYFHFLKETSKWRRKHREAEYGKLRYFYEGEKLDCLNVINSNLKIPLRIVCGAQDSRIPFSNSVEFVKSNRKEETPDILVYGNEGHKIKQLIHRIEYLTWIIDFFSSAE